MGNLLCMQPASALLHHVTSIHITGSPLLKLHTHQTFCLSVTLYPLPPQVRREMLAQAQNGIIIPPLTSFDGNVITPGTPFMARLAAHLRRFLAYKVGSDSDWRHIQVIPAHMHIPIPTHGTVTVGTPRSKHGLTHSEPTPISQKGVRLLSS